MFTHVIINSAIDKQHASLLFSYPQHNRARLPRIPSLYCKFILIVLRRHHRTHVCRKPQRRPAAGDDSGTRGRVDVRAPLLCFMGRAHRGRNHPGTKCEDNVRKSCQGCFSDRYRRPNRSKPSKGSELHTCAHPHFAAPRHSCNGLPFLWKCSLCIRDLKEAFSVRPRFPDQFQYMTLDVEDNEEQNLIRIYPQ